MGICIRTSTVLSLELPRFIWKQLVGQKIDIDDLRQLDDGILSKIQDIIDCKDQANFEQQFEGTYFTTELSDFGLVELIEGGSNKLVTFDNRIEYCKAVV